MDILQAIGNTSLVQLRKVVPPGRADIFVKLEWENPTVGPAQVALDAVASYGPDALVVSLGVNTYVGDPISAFALEGEHFPLMGRRLVQLRLPTVFVQEGGYAVEDLGLNVAGVLGGFEAAR